MSDSENVAPPAMPSAMPLRQSIIAGAIFCFLSTSMQRMSGSPAFTSVASWRVKAVRSFAFTRPRRKAGSLISICPNPFFFPGAFAAGAFAGFFAVFAAAGAPPPPFTSPIAVGNRPCARMAAIAPARSPASIVPRRSWPALSFAMNWNVAM